MEEAQKRCSTGVSGLDKVLESGLPCERLYLVEGSPGVGKTTLALQFLLEGIRLGERCLYVTLSETKHELDVVARSHGWSLEGMHIIELSQIESVTAKAQSTLFQPAEIELTTLSSLILAQFEKIKPSRMVVDSLSELRLLAQNPLRYRRQVLKFKSAFAESGCTVLILDDNSVAGGDVQVHSIVHGAVSLIMSQLRFGIYRRYLSISKLRGGKFLEGKHDYVIQKGGLVVYPRLVAADHFSDYQDRLFKSGDGQLDLLTGGGFHAGTSNLVMGPAGSGKTTLTSMFVHTAASQGHKTLFIAFDENVKTMLRRAREVGLDLDPCIDKGTLDIRQVNPAEVGPGELASYIMNAVEKEHVELLVLDSLNGYVNSMPQDDLLHLHLHELLSYLNQNGVCTIMLMAQHGLIGQMGAPVDVSYLADTVMLTRFFEARGAVKKAISIIKKRSGLHETSIRELKMTANGISVGESLSDFEGVLTGVPRYVGAGERLSR